MPDGHALEVEALVKVYDVGRFGGASAAPTRALDGLELQVPTGTAFGLIGPNGAGKTTFLKTLLGVVRPTSGRVRVLGGDPEQVEVRRRIGYLPERLQLMPAWKPLAYLESIGRLKGLGDVRGEAVRQLERVGLRDARGQRIRAFSKGMRQRLGLAAALLGGPELLVLDEPTDGIDPKGRVDVRTILEQERARGATLFLNSHLLAETERVCDRIGILLAGKMRRSGTLDELCATQERFRVRFLPGADRAALVSAGFIPSLESGDVYLHEGDARELDPRLAAARATGAVLVELAADTRSLEDVLLSLMEAPPA